MPDAHALSPLLRWESFYVIVGGAAAALTGLQFVVIAVVGETRAKGSHETIGAFATPTIVHFAAVLWLSALLSAPWNRFGIVAVVLALTGAAGLVYGAQVFLRARRQTGYEPVLEDWLWHTAFPFVAYAMVLAAGLSLVRHPIGGLFAIGAAAVFLLFIGIHNAWDAVTYLTLERLRSESGEAKPGEHGTAPSEPPSG